MLQRWWDSTGLLQEVINYDINIQIAMRYFFYLLGLFSLILVISLIYLGFHHPNTSSVKSVAMSDYANTNASVSFTINGFTTGDESHRIIKITINNQSRMIEIL
jgi:hypothetical protein